VEENKSKYIQIFKDYKCCVLIPTYNNSKSIANVVQDVLEYCNDVYIINDGSTDKTSAIIEKFNTQTTILSYENNVGKGNALQVGFRQAIKDGYQYAITIDSDGQHYASDLPIFLEKLESEPKAVMIGSRQLEKTNIKGSSSFANKFSNFWFKVETGISLEDTQSGYRLYPLEPISKMKFFTKKYEFEIEIIVRLSWRAYNVISVPIEVFYPEHEDRVSHFRPFKDFFRISVLNTVLVTLALLFFLPRNIARTYNKQKLKEIFRKDILGSDTPAHIIAASIGFGVFMGILPVWGYQLIIGFSVAHLLKLKKGIFFIAANISLPPMIPFILYFSYIVGGFVLGRDTWAISMDDLSIDLLTMKSNIIQYFLGATILAVLAGLIFGLISYLILSIRKKSSTK
jgi:glycosyltransferase involved in cell wall biosynthesis